MDTILKSITFGPLHSKQIRTVGVSSLMGSSYKRQDIDGTIKIRRRQKWNILFGPAKKKHSTALARQIV
jgi:hypothetical protein